LGELLKKSAGIEIVHVPYKSPAAALTDLLAGQVQIYFETTPLIVPQAEFGRFISTETRKWTAIIRASGIKVD
jgi:tripartite-type tricarboxylate transporter receptor subunit TctC